MAGIAGRGHAVVLSQHPRGRIQIHLRNERAVGDAMLALVVDFRLRVVRTQMAVAQLSGWRRWPAKGWRLWQMEQEPFKPSQFTRPMPSWAG